MPIDRHEAISMVIAELDRAYSLHPKWPKDRFDQARIITEKSRDLRDECLKPKGTPIKEAVHVAAMAIRFLEATP